MRVLITGYTYTRQNLFDVFESYPEKNTLSFILPNNWTAKNGTVRFEPFTRPGFDIYHTPAFFSHSHYPFIGGLFKGWMPFFFFRLLHLKFTKGVDVMFSTGEPNLLSTTYNALWAKLLGIKFIFNYWENIPYEKKDAGLKLIIKKAIIRMNIFLSDGAICGMHKAEDILRTFTSTLPIGTFLHAGFDPERFNPDVPPTMPHPDATVFLFVGALGYRKGIHLMLDALAELKETYSVHCIIVGSGEYGNVLREKAQTLGIAELITWIPWLPNQELPSIYTSSDVFVYPSIPYQGWEEQFGYSIAEASLCGLPVISTNTGSIYEVLLDGTTGIMVEPDNVDRLRGAMERMIIDTDVRLKLGSAGRTYVKEHFSNTVIAHKLREFFGKVLVS